MKLWRASPSASPEEQEAAGLWRASPGRRRAGFLQELPTGGKVLLLTALEVLGRDCSETHK